MRFCFYRCNWSIIGRDSRFLHFWQLNKKYEESEWITEFPSELFGFFDRDTREPDDDVDAKQQKRNDKRTNINKPNTWQFWTCSSVWCWWWRVVQSTAAFELLRRWFQGLFTLAWLYILNISTLRLRLIFDLNWLIWIDVYFLFLLLSFQLFKFILKKKIRWKNCHLSNEKIKKSKKITCSKRRFFFSRINAFTSAVELNNLITFFIFPTTTTTTKSKRTEW